MEKSCKVVFAGDNDSGKTLIAMMLKDGPIKDIKSYKYMPSIFENFSKDFEINGNKLWLHIWDTPGNDEFDRLRSISYQDAEIILLIFDFENKQTFDNLEERWIKEANYYSKEAKLIVIGNNADSPNKKLVLISEVKQFCNKHQIEAFISVDPFTGRGLDKILEKIVHFIGGDADKDCRI